MPEQKSSMLTMPVAIVFGSIIIAGAVLLSNKTSAPTAAGEEQPVVHVSPVAQNDHLRGAPDAGITLIEYADFECPYCDVIHGTLKQIVEASGGTVNWVYRNLPLDSIHAEARPAALAAECVASLGGNDAYWKFADTMFANQKDLGAALYKKTATDLGIDATAFGNCLTSKKFEDVIDSQVTEATQAGVQGTPFTVVVSKKGTEVPFSGALPASQIQAIIKTVNSK